MPRRGPGELMYSAVPTSTAHPATVQGHATRAGILHPVSVPRTPSTTNAVPRARAPSPARTEAHIPGWPVRARVMPAQLSTPTVASRPRFVPLGSPNVRTDEHASATADPA